MNHYREGGTLSGSSVFLLFVRPDAMNGLDSSSTAAERKKKRKLE